MDPRIAELLQRLAEVSDDELAELEDIIVAQIEEAAEVKDVASARGYAEAVEKVRIERAERARQAQERDREIAEIMGRIKAQNEGTEGDEDEGDEGSESEGDGSDKPEGEGTGDEDKPEGDSPEGRIAASSRPLPKIADLARKRASSTSKKPERRPGATIVTAATDVPGLSAGAEIGDRETLRKAFVERWMTLSGSRGLTGRVPVARVTMDYPEDRILRSGDEEGNYLKLQKFLSPTALVASGGICAPPAGFYDVTTLATGDRPIRGSLPVFGAERGGIRYIRASTVSDVTGAVGHTTEAEDVSGTSKPCLTITCEAVQETLINAVSRCLQFGNFNARTHPEYVSHIIDLAISAQARTAEQNLWEEMCDQSTAVTAAENLSAWRDLYATIQRAGAAMRSRHRMRPDAMLRLYAPFWLVNLLSVDLARQMPGDSTQAVAQAQFEAWMRVANIAVTWALEGGTDAPTQIFGTQGAGPLDGWPDNVEMILHPEGAFLFLDGGTLDLGVVRDSTLNQTNDFQVFAETFENVAFLGPESLCITLDICPSGLVAGQDDSPMNCAAGVSS